MQLIGPEQQDRGGELAVIRRMLPLADAKVLELGCGAAEKTRLIAERFPVAAIVAAEIDAVQHAKNQRINDLPHVSFESFGAEDIPYEDARFDLVLMFKSLHHVPMDSLGHALGEIRRVLKPGGLLYVSEPVFDGAFNDIMRLYHDEEVVRQAAFDALIQAVGSGSYQLEEEYFFKTPVRFESFDQYERGILNVSHSDFKLTPEIVAEVKRRFHEHDSPEGYCFDIPNRVDLLRRP